MRPSLWILLAVLGGGLLLLIVNDDSGSVFGLDNDSFARMLYLGLLVVVIGSAVLARRTPLSGMARNIAVWIAIMVALVAGHQYRYELQDIANRVTAGLVPGSPLSIGTAETGHMVRLDKQGDGHFFVRAAVDGVPVRFVIDTGATLTVLTAEDARRAGVNVDSLAFNVPVSTANGVTYAARATADDISVGSIVRRRMPVLVAAPGSLGQSLLGMNFLGSLSGYDVRGDAMILRD